LTDHNEALPVLREGDMPSAAQVEDLINKAERTLRALRRALPPKHINAQNSNTDMVPLSAERLRSVCDLQGITRWSLSRKIGVSPAAITRATQTGVAKRELIDASAQVLGVSAAYLSGQGDEMLDIPPEWNTARRLRFARHRAGFTQQHLARAIGVSSATINGWESGRQTTAGLEKRDLDAIAGVLGFSTILLRGSSASQRIKTLRAKHNLTVDKFAELVECSPAQVEMWESESRRPTRWSEAKIEKAFGQF
jgi:transcriptional regulator with XRE-family HTH domain